MQILCYKKHIQILNSSNDNSMWLQFVKNVLCDLGFSHVWNNQRTLNASPLLFSVKHKLKERFIIFWGKRLASEGGMKKMRIYKLLRAGFAF